jgi:hypothetical protein
VVDDLVQQVERLVHRTENNRESELAKAYTAELLQTVPILGERLIFDAEAPLREIKELLGETDPVYTNCMQKVYEEVNYCGVLPFNKYIDALNSSVNDLSRGMRIIEQARYDKIINLFDQAVSKIGGVQIPIKHQIIQNKSGIEDDKKSKDDLLAKLAAQKPPSTPQPGGSSETNIPNWVWWVVILFVLRMCGSMIS